MSGYRELLEAAIAHLEALRESGERFVAVNPASLAVFLQSHSGPKPVRGSSVAKGSAPAMQAATAAVSAPGTPPAPARPLPDGVAARWSRAVAGPRSATGGKASAGESSAPSAVPADPASAKPLPPRMDPAQRRAAMDDLRRRAAECLRCPNLAASRRSVVVGVGDVNARLLFVGEAPGADEDRQGEPFVGAAGELLTKIIVAMNLSRERVFIANVLKCRPDTPGQSYGNRKPTPKEMATCLPWLQEQIEILQPDVMVALGATAVEGLLGRPVPITRLRGQWQSYRGIPLMPTYHPAFLLRSQSPSDKRLVWEDMLAVLERLQLPISERQRGFFRPKGGAASS